MNKPSIKQIAEAIYSLMSRANVDEQILVKQISNYLIQERRSADLAAIMRQVENMRLVRDNKLELTSTSAFPLSNESKAVIIEMFGGKDTVIKENIDSRMISGTRIRGIDKLLDISVKGRIDRLINNSKKTTEVKI